MNIEGENTERVSTEEIKSEERKNEKMKAEKMTQVKEEMKEEMKREKRSKKRRVGVSEKESASFLFLGYSRRMVFVVLLLLVIVILVFVSGFIFQYSAGKIGQKISEKIGRKIGYKRIVTVDVTSLTKEFILKESKKVLSKNLSEIKNGVENEEETESELRFRSRGYLKRLDYLLERVARENQVIIFSNKSILAGSEDVTDQIRSLMFETEFEGGFEREFEERFEEEHKKMGEKRFKKGLSERRKAGVREIKAMNQSAIIYTKRGCSYCNEAKEFLNKKKISYREIMIDRGRVLYDDMVRRSAGRTTIPQVFINGRHIGGYDELVQFIR